MSQESEILNPLLFPLSGNSLIEASAGTGKTYTIAALYTRLILGHGGSKYGHRRTLIPKEILVVTFTNAATQELRNRISQRLSDAAGYFNLDANSQPDDFLVDLRAAYPPSQWSIYAHQLKKSAQAMDQSAVLTIHSWCQRMLREHAFHIGNLFNYTLTPDQQQLLTEIFYDYWRKFIAPLDITVVERLKGWKLDIDTPKKLFTSIKTAMKDISIIKPAPEPASAKNQFEIIRHAVHWIGDNFANEQQRLRQIGYDELLTQFNVALSGVNGASLAKIIRHNYPVALIDEFQDTDPVQYQIFDKIYHVADYNPNTALILIGDPKQSIYAFRGADIYTYLQAKRACQNRLYTLKENFRSTSKMVAAINHCFSVAEERQNTKGAFLFREKVNNPIPFSGVIPRGLKEELLINGEPQPSLTIWYSSIKNKKDYRSQMANICAREITHLLNLGQNGQAIFSGTNTDSRPIQPCDIAILVNNRYEAKMISTELLKCGVRTVYLSDQDSIFQSPDALDLQYWLAACAEPTNNKVRAALATGILNLSWTELDNLQHHESIWDEYILRFRVYQDCWRRKGIMPMIRTLIHDFNLPMRMLNQNSAGSRTLTNILHLAEVLQQASINLNGEHALIRYLREQINNEDHRVQSDYDQIRLESGANLVKIVTIHKSKGLAYPLVFLPFASNYPEQRKKNFTSRWHNSAGQLRSELNEEISDEEQIKNEQHAEELRKFYVALTRAKYATWATIAPLGKLEQSAFGYLLGIKNKSIDLESELNQWNYESIKISPVDLTETRNIYYSEIKSNSTQYTVREAKFIAREPWWIASYSSLRGYSHNAPETLKEKILQEVQTESQRFSETNILYSNPDELLHNFPQGAEAGNLLHGLLEWIAHQGFFWVTKHPEELHTIVTRRCNLRDWPQWSEPLTNWLSNFLGNHFQISASDSHAPMSFSFANLRLYTAELEFWISAHQVDIKTLDRIIQENTLNQAIRPELQSGQINGMLKGFIDLVFEHHGRYYVADYKSNWLGGDNNSYTQDALRTEILRSRYDLQYILYLFALHRLLKTRLPNYDYERHIGGAIYLFLRGINASGQGIYFDRPPFSLISQIDQLFIQHK